jgi:hypothetical protein
MKRASASNAWLRRQAVQPRKLLMLRSGFGNSQFLRTYRQRNDQPIWQERLVTILSVTLLPPKKKVPPEHDAYEELKDPVSDYVL